MPTDPNGRRLLRLKSLVLLNAQKPITPANRPFRGGVGLI